MFGLSPEIASLNEIQFVVDVLSPEGLELVHSDVEPGLHVAVEVDHGRVSNFFQADAGVVAEAQNMPRLVQRLCGRVVRDQPRWQRSQLPQRSVFVLHFNIPHFLIKQLRRLTIV